MVTHAGLTHALPPDQRTPSDFEYYRAPHAGLNWPFLRQMILSLMVLSSTSISALFWACLLVGAVR